MRHSRRFRSLSRQVEVRAPKAKIIIYSEGEKTERDYFEAAKRAFRGVVLDMDFIGGAGVPLTIAEKAVEASTAARRQHRRQSYARNDEFWAVFDRDAHDHVAKAIARCDSAHISVAFSDPCFELWLLLHIEDFDRPDDRHGVQHRLEAVCSDYDRVKRKTTDCNKLLKNVIDAERRAETQLNRRMEEGNPPRRPFTTVYRLTRRLRDA